MRKYICGKNSVIDAIKHNLPIKTIFVLKPLNFYTKNLNIKIVKKDFLNQITQENHQGYIAELKEINFFSIEEIFKDNPHKIIILDHIQDPHNFGAIIRTANAAGIKHIIIPKERAVGITPAVFKVASGGNIGIKIIRVSSLTNTIQKLKKNNIWIYATSLNYGQELDEVSFNKPMAIIFGNESKGVSKSLLKLSDQNFYIKMKGTIQSLNVSVAVGIILFKIK